MTTRRIQYDEIGLLQKLLEEYPFRPYAYYRSLPSEATVNYLKASLAQSELWGSFSDSGPVGLAAFKELAWDSEQLGFRVAKIDHLLAVGPYGQAIQTKKALLDAMLTDPRNRGIRYIACRVNADDLSGLHLLEQQNFVTVDGILTFSLDLSRWFPTSMDIDYEVRPARESELDEIRSIGATAFVYDRFHSDPIIPRAIADKLKATWVENACRGVVADLVIVASKDHKVLGFVTCKINRSAGKCFGTGIGSLDLVAVSAEARGKGVAYWISQASLEWFKKNGMRFVEVGTQFRNHAASTVYQKAGFKLVSSSITLRKWIG